MSITGHESIYRAVWSSPAEDLLKILDRLAKKRRMKGELDDLEKELQSIVSKDLDRRQIKHDIRSTDNVENRKKSMIEFQKTLSSGSKSTSDDMMDALNDMFNKEFGS